METVRRIFAGMNGTYLVRAYVIGLLFLALMALGYFGSDADRAMPARMIAVGLINTLLFPFSKLIWDELKSFLLGQTVVVGNVGVVFLGKLFINALLWALAVFVAPLGVAYLWFRTREA